MNLTQTGRGLGTPHFMAPEQFRNAKSADARCDIYSLGTTLYMMVTGELPYRAKSPFETWTKKIKGDLTPPRQFAPGLARPVQGAHLAVGQPRARRTGRPRARNLSR